ncbi:hypothetical protein [Rhizobium sp. L1K21]|uniref:hypothetical protein n=1 Tax=Rhizobium sp. L1K21 TaxID=2954933 RepID=UPI0020934E56|nr:hypothetical protein [Rhizobium sp. L1K21]MCO6184756.1 hypothetical protein [Rhizobium sp. L1K21]
MIKRFFIAGLLLFLSGGLAFAHVGTSGFVLLLPSRFYMLGAALAVAASFLLLAFLPQRAAKRMLTEPKPLVRLPTLPFPLFSLVSFLLLLSFVVYGFTGPGDPFENPITLFIWIVWWIVFTLVQVVTGELWSTFNPWSGVAWIVRFGRDQGKAILMLPAGRGYWIAIVQFLAFAWLELVSTSAYDPETLATATVLFWCFNFAGILIFGERRWLAEAEPFSVFFGLVGALSPFERKREAESGRTGISLVWPGKSLIKREALPLGGSLFVLLTLSTVSFDGFSNTFLWVSSLGLNPLEFEGRSAVTMPMSVGLIVAFALLAGLFYLCVYGGKMLAGAEEALIPLAGRLVYSILPISIVFQFAHYLTYLLVQGQYALKLASDPFGRGWDLFGTTDWQVTTSFFYGYGSVLAIWNAQTAAIVLGHLIGITMAHLIALDIFRDNRKAVRSQIFLAGLMVAYTAFGLWLLSSPKVG